MKSVFVSCAHWVSNKILWKFVCISDFINGFFLFFSGNPGGASCESCPQLQVKIFYIFLQLSICVLIKKSSCFWSFRKLYKTVWWMTALYKFLPVKSHRSTVEILPVSSSTATKKCLLIIPVNIITVSQSIYTAASVSRFHRRKFRKPEKYSWFTLPKKFVSCNSTAACFALQIDYRIHQPKAVLVLYFSRPAGVVSCRCSKEDNPLAHPKKKERGGVKRGFFVLSPHVCLTKSGVITRF